MLGSAPYILVIGHVLTVVVIGLVWKVKLWAQYKNTGSYSRLSLPFSFLRFSSPPPLFAPATLAILLCVIVCFDFVLFSLAPASLRQTVFT